jgi:hypothetical protein
MLLVPPLLDLMKTPTPQVVSLAIAALVNISHGNKDIKQLLMNSDLAEICATLLQTKDESILLNTLILIRNLAMNTSHRRIFA